MKYSPSLDGLRAVAILPVLVFHALPGTLNGGFTGVDVFFVLSGYLICSVILHDMRAGAFSMREFYLRRIQRLLPNAVLMVLATLLIALVALTPMGAVKLATHGLWTLANLSNVYIRNNVGGYWSDGAASVPLLHTWSIAVEEQFYLLFPATLLLLTRWLRPSLFAATAGLACAGFALNVWRVGAHPEATFYLLPTRAWEPLLGAALAVYRVPPAADRPLRAFRRCVATEVAGWAGLTMIVAGCLFITDDMHFPGAIGLVPTVGTLAVLVSIADGETSVARLLAAPSLVAVGAASYSLYLWHWPLIVIGRTFAEYTGRSPRTWAICGAIAGVLLAIAAYRFIEQPLRRRGSGRGRRLAIIAGGAALCAGACFVVSRRQPVADPAEVFDRPTSGMYRYDVVGTDASHAVLANRYYDVLFDPEQRHAPDVWRSGGIVHDWGHGPPRVVVLGSSHALMYGGLIDDVCRRQGLSVAFLSANGSSAFFPTASGPTFRTPELAREFDDARRKWLNEWKPDVVLVIDRWEDRSDVSGEFDRQVRDLVRELESSARRVVLFSQVPVLRIGEDINLREFVTMNLRSTGALPVIPPDGHETLRRSAISVFETIARSDPKFRLLRADESFYRDDGSVRYADGRNCLYADDDHLTDAGAEQLRDVCAQAISKACSSD